MHYSFLLMENHESHFDVDKVTLGMITRTYYRIKSDVLIYIAPLAYKVDIARRSQSTFYITTIIYSGQRERHKNDVAENKIVMQEDCAVNLARAV